MRLKDAVRIAKMRCSPPPERIVRDTMGLLRVTMSIASTHRESVRRDLPHTLVDTGAELSWAPRAVLEALGITARKRIRFTMADGNAIERDVGYAIVAAGGEATPDEIVFGEPGDLVLLGARSLQGLNLKVDLVQKRLVAGGPMLAACRLASCRLVAA